MERSVLDGLQQTLLAERKRSRVVRMLYEERFELWKQTLADTHGFHEGALAGDALEELYLAESTYVLATMLYVQQYVDDLPIGSAAEWEEGSRALPGIYRAVGTMYGWVIGAIASDQAESLQRRITDFRVPLGSDPFKDAYESSIPHDVRHRSGAFLTPSWMVDHLLDRLFVDVYWLDKRILEPSAGTGAFLVSIIQRVQSAVAAATIAKSQAIDFLSRNFVAIERNPVSCLALTTNLLAGLAHIAGGKISATMSRGVVLFADCTDEAFYSNGRTNPLIFDDLPPRESFDYVVGNPPWISWETLDRPYRQRIAPIWERLGLFSGSGSTKSFSKEDICTFITYVCMDRFLRHGGMLSFVLPQGIFQSSLNSRGFRRFALLNSGSSVPLRVKRVDDMTRIPAFKGASTRPAILSLEKGKPTEYPVEYNVFSRKGNGSVLQVEELIAEPANPQDLTSPWSIHSRNYGSENFRRVNGVCAYRARAGVFTGGANAAYYLERCEASAELVKATTVAERAKRKLSAREVLLEPDFIYPFVRGRDVSFWRADLDPARGIILPHTPETKIAPVSPEQLHLQAPRTLAYFNEVRDFLDGRNGLTAMDRANAERGFYTVLRVGAYSFSPFKVVWKYIDKDFTCAVIGPSRVAQEVKPVIPQEKLMMIDFSVEEEAYFVCGVLSATAFTSAIKSRMVSTQISAKIIDCLRVPRFSSAHQQHREISTLCKQGHEARKRDADVSAIRERLDHAVEALLEE